MRKFDYRAPRYPVNLEVRLSLEDSIYIGRCTEISTEGMKLELNQQFEPGSSGSVQFSHRGLAVDVPVRITFSAPDHAGLKFLYDSDQQREDVVHLVSLSASPRFSSTHLVIR